MRHIRLQLADARLVTVRPDLIFSIEALAEGANPHFPTARSFVRLDPRTGFDNLVLLDTVDDILSQLGEAI